MKGCPGVLEVEALSERGVDLFLCGLDAAGYGRGGRGKVVHVCESILVKL